MGTLISSPPVGKPLAKPATSSDTSFAPKKSRKAHKASSPGHAVTKPASSEPRSFAAVYRKSLDRSRSSGGAEAADSSPEKTAKRSSLSALADHEIQPRHEKNRKKKGKAGTETVALPMVAPAEEESAKILASSPAKSKTPPSGLAKAQAPVLWGPQNGRAALGSVAGGRSGEEGAGSLAAPVGSPGTDASFARAMGAAGLPPPLAKKMLAKEGLTAGGDPEKKISKEAGRAKARESLPGESSGLSLPDLVPSADGGASATAAPSSQASQGLAGTSAGRGEGTSASSRQSTPDGALLASGAEASGATSIAGAKTAKGAEASSTPVLPSDLSGRVSTLASGGGGQVALEVRPPHLGPVGVRVHVDPATRLVKVELSSHDPHIRHLLSEKEGAIKESLSQSGFVLDRFQVASQTAPGATALDAASGLAASGGTQGSDMGGRGSEDSGSSSNSGGASTADPGAFFRQGANQSGREPGGGQGFAGGGSAGSSYASEEPEDLLSALPAGDRGLSRQAGYHRIA